MQSILPLLLCLARAFDGNRFLTYTTRSKSRVLEAKESNSKLKSIASQLLTLYISIACPSTNSARKLSERSRSRACRFSHRCAENLAMLAEHEADDDDDVHWRSIPHVDPVSVKRSDVFRSVAATATSMMLPANSLAGGLGKSRTASSIDSHPAIPVWPVWPTLTSPTGGRVIPVSLPSSASDPFLLLAHHRHSFSPGDPLRGPFKAIGGALGLPYVGDEGFAIHPHRGIDILTYILDGSDGFRHKDSLGGERTYRGGACQFMRSGRGALHEEMWETRSDRPTKIELFQIWVNLPRTMKMGPPAIRYIGSEYGAPYAENMHFDSNGVPTRVRTIDEQLVLRAPEGEGDVLGKRPDMKIRHATIDPGGVWTAEAPREHTALCYVRQGAVNVNGQILGEVKAGSTCLFERDGDEVTLVNIGTEPADLLLLTGQPLREPVALGGPIVMNTEEELQQAYSELRSGTFLS